MVETRINRASAAMVLATRIHRAINAWRWRVSFHFRAEMLGFRIRNHMI